MWDISIRYHVSTSQLEKKQKEEVKNKYLWIYLQETKKEVCFFVQKY
jgi:hypothetical protein